MRMVLLCLLIIVHLKSGAILRYPEANNYIVRGWGEKYVEIWINGFSGKLLATIPMKNIEYIE